ncbi:LuxR C-terminal-related transcriptional regulator [Neobacillus niacini]|uniref:LuxR C-terminal-related transcriptional regulator n=1 Tax=Neobacillus niacini TaxID=86668 RepID=UPI003000970D
MEQTDILKQVSDLTNISNHEDKLYSILQTYIDIFPVKDAFLYRYSPIGYLCEGVIGLSSSRIIHIREERASIKTASGFIPLLKDKKARFYTGIEFTKLMTSDYIFSSKIDSALVVPLCIGPVIIGFILSYHIDGEPNFDKKLLETITHFGKLSGSLLENNEMVGNTQILSKREVEVMQRISWGENTEEIADLLGIGNLTIQQYVKSVLKKLKVQNRTHAIAVLLRKGMIT